MSWLLYEKPIDCRCDGLIVDFQFCSLACVSTLMPVCHYVDYYWYTLSSEIRKYESSSFLFFQDCFGFLGPLNFHMNFRINLSISAKKLGWTVDWDCVDSAYDFEKYWYPNTKSSELCTWDTHTHTYVYMCIYMYTILFGFFQQSFVVFRL